MIMGHRKHQNTLQLVSFQSFHIGVQNILKTITMIQRDSKSKQPNLASKTETELGFIPGGGGGGYSHNF